MCFFVSNSNIKKHKGKPSTTFHFSKDKQASDFTFRNTHKLNAVGADIAFVKEIW